MANETMVLLEKIVVPSGGASSVTFTSIPQSYTDLVVKCSYRTNNAQIYDQLRLTFNGSSTAVYSFRGITGNGIEGSSESSSSVASIKVAPGGGNSATASTFTNDKIYIPNYTSSNNKSLSSEGVGENNATTAYVSMFAGLWSNTAAITQITLVPESNGNFLQYSTFYLYGVAKQGVTPTNAPAATGGDSIVFDGTYWIHTFYSSGTFTPKKNLTCDYLVVAGGGGGGCDGGGGGGAGGLRSTVTATGGGGSLESVLSLIASTAYTVTVGAGGAGSAVTTNKGSNGSNSVFSTITSTGGGGGGSADVSVRTGATGGSGGGARMNTASSGGAGTSNQGYAGGSSASAKGAGGGGGANAVGADGIDGPGSALDGGNGGAGVAVAISGSSVTYAGGGGGGAADSASAVAGTGGAGGGGAGGRASSGVAGTANTGGGGGGDGGDAGRASGGAGGSGIVIVRYAA